MSSTEHWRPVGSEAQGCGPAHMPLPGSRRLLETRYHQKEAPAHEGHAPQPQPGGRTPCEGTQACAPVTVEQTVLSVREPGRPVPAAGQPAGAVAQPQLAQGGPQTFPRGRLLAEIKSGHFLEGNRPYRSPDIQAHCYEKQNFQSKEQMWKSSPGSSCVPADGPGFKALPKCSQRKRTWQHLGQNSQWQPLCLWHTSSLLS